MFISWDAMVWSLQMIVTSLKHRIHIALMTFLLSPTSLFCYDLRLRDGKPAPIDLCYEDCDGVMTGTVMVGPCTTEVKTAAVLIEPHCD